MPQVCNNQQTHHFLCLSLRSLKGRRNPDTLSYREGIRSTDGALTRRNWTFFDVVQILVLSSWPTVVVLLPAVICDWCATRFLKHEIPDCLVRSTDLFSLTLSNTKMTIANTTAAVCCEWIKIMPIFVRLAINIMFFGVSQYLVY